MANLVSFHPFVRRPYQFTAADASGSMVTHHDLLLEALKLNPSSLAVLLPERISMFASWANVRDVRGALEALPRETASRIHSSPFPYFRDTALFIGDWIGLGKSSEVAELSMMRASLPKPVPICAIVHSALFPSIIQTYLSAIVLHRQGDYFVASSVAAQKATKTLLEQSARTLTSSLFNGVNEQIKLPEVVHIPHGISDDWLQVPDKSACRSILNIHREDLVVLYVGRLSREYKADLEPLVRSFGRALGTCPSAILVIAGSTAHAVSEVEALSHSLGEQVRGRVRILHDFSPMLKRSLYGCADLFVSPVDNLQESFGLTILEAMASRLPVLASDWSGYREIVRNGQEGLLIDTMVDPCAWTDASALAGFSLTPASEFCVAQRTVVNVDQMTRTLTLLLSDSNLRQRLGQAGHQRVRDNYTWSKIIPQFSALWDEQIRQCKDNCQRCANSPIDLSVVFAGYPTQTKPQYSHTVVFAPALGVEEYAERYPEDLNGISLLRHCADSPRLLADVVRLGSHGSPRIYRLLKLGYLVEGLPARKAVELG